MKSILSIGVILILLIAGGVWSNRSLSHSTEAISHQIDHVTGDIKSDNWMGAVEKTAALEKLWDQKARWWPIFLDHQEMDNISFSMARIKEYVAARNYAMSMGQLSEMKLMVRHIPDKEAVTLKNIL